MRTTAGEQQDAVINLYRLMTEGSLVITEDDNDIQAMCRFAGLFYHFVDSPRELDELNRRWIPTFYAAKDVVSLLEKGRIRIVHVGGMQ